MRLNYHEFVPGQAEDVPPALSLFLLSPIMGELLSGSAPPAEFSTPFGFTVMTLLYARADENVTITI